MREEIRTDLDDTEKQGNSLVRVRKNNGKLRLYLNPKDLNRAVMHYHHKTPTMEQFAHKVSGAQLFSKVDAKNRY